MLLENSSKGEDYQTLENAKEEIKNVAAYIDKKKGEAMSKVKVGEIEGAVTGAPVCFFFFIFRNAISIFFKLTMK